MMIDSVTKNYYEELNVVKAYARWTHIWPPEEIIFDRFKSHLRDKKVLDIGCGAGRTTTFLKAMTQHYVGIDYSEKMIEVCKNQYPSLHFVVCDSSDMSLFSDESFDFVMFSFNGIDCMSNEKRIGTLNEVFRVLKRDGVFAFSSHNRDNRRIVVAFNRYERISLESLRQNVRNVRSYLKSRKGQVRTATYDILSDPLAGFGQLTYYIRKQDQLRQLESIGFQDPQILNWDSEFVAVDTLDQTSQWLYYVCRKW